MTEYLKHNSVKPRMTTGVLNSAIHNFSSKGHKPRHRNKCDVWQHLVFSTYLSRCFYGAVVAVIVW